MADRSENGRQFFCREWAWAKLWACVEQRPSAKTCGALLVGGPGTGKSALCTELVTPSTSYGRHATLLHERLLAHHFCYAHDGDSLNVSTFILNLVNQLSLSPLIPEYATKVKDNDIQAAIESYSLNKYPDEAIKRAVLFPLLEIDPPESTLILLIDSIDEAYLQAVQTIPCHPAPKDFHDSLEHQAESSVLSSRTVAELLATHHHLLPQWLLLIISVRRGSKSVIRQFSGFRRIALDDLRRSHVVRDVQQYILCRLDREPSLRHHLSRETAEMLNQLHIKSNGCFLYLEKVLDGVSEGWVTLREIRDIPGTLNGLYLWLCQRLYPRRHFLKVSPLLAVILASRKPVNEAVLQTAVSTKFPDIQDDWSKRWALLKRILCPFTSEYVILFHHSFAEWLLDVKHCTQRYLVDVSQGHAMLAMYYTCNAKILDLNEIHDFAFHLARVPLISPLEGFHLPLWLVNSGIDFEKCAKSSRSSWDFKALKLLQEAGANILTDFDDVDEEEYNDEGVYDNINGNLEIMCVKTDIADCDDINVHDPIKMSDTCELIIENKINLLQSLPHSKICIDSDKCEANKAFLKNSLSNSFPNIRNFECGTCISDKKFGSEQAVCDLKEKETEFFDLQTSNYSGENNKITCNHNYGKKMIESETGKRHRKHREDPLYPYLRGGPVDQLDAAGRSLLHTAAHQGDSSLVQVLLEQNADHTLQDRSGQTPLNLAARHGHAEVVSTLLRYGANPDHADGDGWTALRSAAWGGHYEVVKALLEGGAQVDLADSDGRTALRAAAWGGHEDVVAALLEYGALVNRADSEGRTPLIAAAYMGHAEIVEMLLANEADVNHTDIDGRTALSVAALCVPASEGHSSVVMILLEKGAYVDHQDKDGLTPLLVAAFEGHTEVCELLLEYEADVDHVDKSGRTPLLAAASMGHSAVVEKLLFWGCYVDHIDTEGRTVLSIAAAQGSQDTVCLLLDRGLDETHRDNAGWTPLHYSAFEGHRVVCQLLIEAGARVNEVDNDGKHALVLAAQEGHTAVVATLLDAGATIHHTSHDGRSALRVAALEGHKDVVHLLLCRGADLHYKDADGRSTLYLLALENRLEMASFLLESGADVESTDLEGRTPLHVTSWQGHADMVSLLLAHRARVDAEDLEKRTPLQSAAWQGHNDIVRILLENGAVPDHSCTQGATALSIAAQEGHEGSVKVLLEYGANPSHSDVCGRTAIKVALKGGHHHLVHILEDHITEQNLQGRPIKSCHRIAHHAESGSIINQAVESPDSTFDKRKSCASLGQQSSKSSGNLTASTRSSTGGCQHSRETSFVQPTQFLPVQSALPPQSFTHQLQECSRGNRGRRSVIPISQTPLTPLDEPCSPIYASPPQSPLSDTGLSPPHHINPVVALMESEYTLPVQSQETMPYSLGYLENQGDKAESSNLSSGFSFNQDQHMRIILGNNSHSPESNRSKRNGIVTNPGFKAAHAKATHILRNGLSGRNRQSSGKINGHALKKETPL